MSHFKVYFLLMRVTHTYICGGKEQEREGEEGGREREKKRERVCSHGGQKRNVPPAGHTRKKQL